MADPQLIVLGQDLIALGLVITTPDTIERKTFKRDKLISNDFDFECWNKDFYFSTGNPKSVFNGVDWLYTSIKYYNSDGILTWDGILINIRNNYREMKTILETKDNLFAFRDNYIAYTSADWETPASAAKNIMDNYLFTYYDNTSIQSSIDYLTSNTVYIKCNFNLSDNLNIYNALEKLAEVCGADCYSSNGNVFFKVWKTYTSGTNIFLNIDRDTRLKSDCILNFLEDEIINDYSIDYDGSLDIPITDATGNNIGNISRTKYGTRKLEPMSTGTGKQIIIKDVTSAKFIGEQYIRRSHKNLSTQPQPLIKIQFDIDIKFKNYINLETYFKLTYPFENWVEKIFEVYEFRRNEDQQNINIVALETV